MTTNRTPAPRRPWIAPEIKDLPRLTELTLQTGDLITGGAAGGSTVIP